jgi:hypothetical protein
MLAPLAPSLRSQERTHPQQLRRMCHPAIASHREELVWVAWARTARVRNNKRAKAREMYIGDLLGFAEGPGQVRILFGSSRLKYSG